MLRKRRLRRSCIWRSSAPRRSSGDGWFRDVFICAFQSVYRHGIFASADVDPEGLVVASEDPVRTPVGSLERPFVTVVTDENVVGRLEVVRDVFRLATVSRRRDGAKALDFIA